MMWAGSPTTANAQAFADVEVGAVVDNPYNFAQVPRAESSRVNFPRDLEPAVPAPFYRVRLGYTFANRHTVSVLAAPVSARYEGVINRPINFGLTPFAAGEELDGYFQFNTYRLSYQYRLFKGDDFKLDVGAVALLRDAAIRLQSDQTNSFGEDTNIGILPLLRTQLWWYPFKVVGLTIEADGSYSNNGSALDAFSGLDFKLGEQANLRAGYRFLTGSAKGEEIQQDLFFNQLSVGLRLSL
jgi:hypothetical protein